MGEVFQNKFQNPWREDESCVQHVHATYLRYSNIHQSMVTTNNVVVFSLHIQLVKQHTVAIIELQLPRVQYPLPKLKFSRVVTPSSGS